MTVKPTEVDRPGRVGSEAPGGDAGGRIARRSSRRDRGESTEVTEITDATDAVASGDALAPDRAGPSNEAPDQLSNGGRLGHNEVSYRSLISGTRRFQARKVRRIVRHVDPWSMFKMAFVLLVCAYAVLMIASVIVWSVAVGSGTIAKIESFVTQAVGNDFSIDGHFLFRFTGLVGLVITLALSAGALVGSIAFNLVSDLIGGVWVTVIEEETARPATSVSGSSTTSDSL